MSDAFTDLFVAFGKACAQMNEPTTPAATLSAVAVTIRDLTDERDQARRIACNLLRIAEERGPKVYGPRPDWLKPETDG